jgi:diguanylate cyclase (GGDEF)-like protein
LGRLEVARSGVIAMESNIRKVLVATKRLLTLSPFATWILFILILACVNYIDYITGPDLDVCFLLMIPTFLISWRFGVKSGLGVSVFCSAASMVANYGDPLLSTHPLIAWLNMLTLAIYLAVFAVIVHTLRVEIELREKLARTDSLTGLLNRRAFDEAIQHEMNRLTRFKRPFTLLVLDLDKFKAVNDTRGHAAGDELLKSVSRVLTGSFRETDIVARIGGDEFAVLLPETDSETALTAIVKLEENIRGMALGSGYPVSASMGFVTNSYPPIPHEKLFEEADRRMYLDKNLKQNGDK